MAARRLKGKPLLEINNLPIICHVVKKAKETGIGKVIVATEDKEIIDDVKLNGGKAILTSNRHKTGSDRIFECFEKLNLNDIDYIINLQGDEPNIDINDLKHLNYPKRKNFLIQKLYMGVIKKTKKLVQLCPLFIYHLHLNKKVLVILNMNMPEPITPVSYTHLTLPTNREV